MSFQTTSSEKKRAETLRFFTFRRLESRAHYLYVKGSRLFGKRKMSVCDIQKDSIRYIEIAAKRVGLRDMKRVRNLKEQRCSILVWVF